MNTVIELYIESGKFERRLFRRIPIFFTLLRLYVLSKFSSGDQETSTKLAGFKVYSFGYPTLIALYREIFLKRIYDFNTRNRQPFIVDCGAHMGMSILYFKKRYPASRIWAFEPDPDLFKLLEKNVRVNKLQDVTLFNVGLSSKEGLFDFYVPVKKGSLNGSFIKGHAEGNAIPVQVVQLSKKISDQTIDFIKIDVEGEEDNIIDDLLTSRAIDHVMKMVVEYHENTHSDEKRDLNSAITKVKQNNFDYVFRAMEGYSWKRQNIVISFKRIAGS